jgi:hypothetical protein
MAERQSDGKYAPANGKAIYVGSLNTLGASVMSLHGSINATGKARFQPQMQAD